jgi:hypothetical protein
MMCGKPDRGHAARIARRRFQRGLLSEFAGVGWIDAAGDSR